MDPEHNSETLLTPLTIHKLIYFGLGGDSINRSILTDPCLLHIQAAIILLKNRINIYHMLHIFILSIHSFPYLARALGGETILKNAPADDRNI